MPWLAGFCLEFDLWDLTGKHIMLSYSLFILFWYIFPFYLYWLDSQFFKVFLWEMHHPHDHFSCLLSKLLVMCGYWVWCQNCIYFPRHGCTTVPKRVRASIYLSPLITSRPHLSISAFQQLQTASSTPPKPPHEPHLLQFFSSWDTKPFPAIYIQLTPPTSFTLPDPDRLGYVFSI